MDHDRWAVYHGRDKPVIHYVRAPEMSLCTAPEMSGNDEVFSFDNLVEALEKLIHLGGTLTPQEYENLLATSPTTLVSYEVRMHFLPSKDGDNPWR